MKNDNLKFKSFLTAAFVFLFLLSTFYFLFSDFAAAQEEKAGFGEECTRADDCSLQLKCISNTCVKCAKQSDCGPSETCDDGVCVGPGGNFRGDLCAKDEHCLFRNCGADNICQELGGKDGGGKTGDGGKAGDGGKTGDGGPLGGFPGEDLEFGDITNIVTGLACWLTRVASILAAIFVILAGLRFVTARDNPEKQQQAIKNFQTVLWGILVIYGVYVIIATVAHAVGITDFSFIPLVC